MQNEIIRLKRGEDLNMRNPPQGIGTPSLKFKNRNEMNPRNEISPQRNRAPHPLGHNFVGMDPPVESQGMLEEDMHVQEDIFHEELDGFEFEDMSLMFTKEEDLGDEHSPDKDVRYQENIVQTHSQLNTAPQK